MINRTQFSPVHRLHPIDKDRQEDDQQDPSKKKKVLYHGRSWAEEEEGLPVQPKKQEPVAQKKSTIMYADQLLLEKAKNFFQKMTTLEEKVAQLFFVEAEATYDAEAQRAIELLLQAWQIGGILFKKGDYRRQTYLIERFLELSKTPLLFANDLIHGLSFYLQGDSLKSSFTSQHYMDLGKAVMVQNRRMGVHIQLDKERKGQKIHLSEVHAKAFRKGIREAQGIVGKQKADKAIKSFSHTYKSALPHFALKDVPYTIPDFEETNIQEAIGFKIVTLFDFPPCESVQELLLGAYRENSDIFVVPREQITALIQLLCKHVREGRISEQELDRRVMRLLIIKVLNTKTQKSSGL